MWYNYPKTLWRSNMEAVAFLFGFIIYFGMIVFGVWFAVSLIKTLKEKNQILKEIARNLENRSKEEI
jgi:cytochrome c biogenesis protein CcdA